MNELHLHRCPDLDALAAAFVASASAPGVDPFARPLLLVPGAGVQRWLSQRVARAGDPGGEGIMAGFDVHRVGALPALLAGHTDDDPWEPTRLVWAILAAADAGDPGLEPLAAHLGANDQRYANALRVARLLRRYATLRPELLTGWSADPDAAAAALGFDGWQVRLWQALRTRVAGPDPVRRHLDLVAAIRDGRHPVGWPAVHVFAPRRATPVARGLVSALSVRVPVHIWLPTSGPAGTANPLGAALGRVAAEQGRLWADVADALHDVDAPLETESSGLARLQASVLAGVPGPDAVADGSITLHASHGLARQAEVLREVLTGLFADDPTLEPRHVVVACPDPAALAPHLAALFVDHPSAGSSRPHPATELRVQVADGGAAGANQLYLLLNDLLVLPSARATASHLVALASHPFVARRFGLSTDDLDRLGELVDAAAIRWGINLDHRSWFGLGDVPQNTWQLGVQRLVLGEAFSDDHLTSVGHVSTVDEVTSTDTALVGALAELVSRVSRIVRSFGTDGTALEWVARLRAAVDLLTDVPFAEGWQLSQVWAALAAIESRGAASVASLRRADALALLTDAFADRGVRPAYGNGSLVVCSLDALARVPHRVVCLVGLDERSFPRRGLGDGDDLMARDPHADTPDPGADDRQAILDAVLAARDRLVVVYQGQSSLTSEPHHPPAGVQELIEAVGPSGCTTEKLQAFAYQNFEAPPRSFDRAALAGARALVGPRAEAPGRYTLGHLHRTEPLTELGLDRLDAFLAHPGKFLLRERAGLTLGDDDPPEERIPLELNGLDQWKIGDAVLAALRAGHAPDAVTRAQWLSGSLPPRRLGASVITAITDKATQVHRSFLKVADAPPEVQVVDLDIEGVSITGRVVTRGGLLAESQYGRAGARHLAGAWVRLLALTVALERRTDAVVVGGNGTERLLAPPVDLARDFLGQLVDLAAQGTERILPLPPRVAEYWAQQRARGRDPLQNDEVLKRDWRFERDAVWKLWFPHERTPWSLHREPGDPWGHPEEKSQLGALAMIAWAPIVKARA